MRLILAILASLILLASGCVPIANDNGPHIFGYTKTTENSRLDLGLVSSNFLIENALRDEPDPFWEEDIKGSGTVFGFFYERRF